MHRFTYAKLAHLKHIKRHLKLTDISKRALRAAKFTLVVSFTTLVLFFLLEGFSSVALLIKEGVPRYEIAERVHTKYDDLLGWVNIPNLDVNDMYGDGVFFRSNSQGFRNETEFPISEDVNRVRVICSGDSFTLGYGVSNDDTWCYMLSRIDRSLETVNMGQGGYGIDQAYLWYKRDGASLEHGIHLFAFITADFHRMSKYGISGYGKPVLLLADGELELTNVPVPKTGEHFGAIYRFVYMMKGLRSVQFGRYFVGIISSSLAFRSAHVLEEQEEIPRWRDTLPIALKVFEDLNRINEEKDSILALVWLPTRDQYRSNLTDIPRQELARELNKRCILFIDLVDEFRGVSEDAYAGMFIEPGEIRYHAAEGHYTRSGNEFIANALVNELTEIETISRKLNLASRN